MARTTIVLTEELQEQAKKLDVNVSEVCRDALAAAVDAARKARKAGDDFEMVTARADEETIQFLGRLVYLNDQTNETWYLTSRGDAAVVDDDNQLEVLDLVAELEPGLIRQLFEEALGEVPTPRFLDI